MIKDINVEVIKPLNILEDGSFDPTKSEWRYGGTIYHIKTEEGIVTVQLEGDLWYEPNYQISSKSLLEVVTEVIKLDKEMCEG